ncbi:MAG: GyrI-like domain-containing protein [Pirellulales bacterium]|nr:GyrI-like domain-containing protein [Pirellulales bacterium]
MDPSIVDREAFLAAGVVAPVRRGAESPELFARIWSDFESRRGELAARAVESSYFGVSFPTGDADVFDYLAGVAVADRSPPPAGCEIRTVAGGRFAVFACPVDGIGATYQQIFGTWLPGAAFDFDGARASFEQYPKDTAKDPVRIHIPVRGQP